MQQRRDERQARNQSSRVFITALVVTAGGLLARAVSDVAAGHAQPLLILGLLACAIAATSARHPVQFPGLRTGMLVSDALTFLAIVCFGPFYGVLLAGVEPWLASRRMRLRPSLSIFNISNIVIAAYAGGQAFHTTSLFVGAHPVEAGLGQPLLAFTLPLAALAIGYYVTNISLISLMSYIRYGASIKESLSDTLPWDPLTYLADAVAAGLVGYGSTHYGPIALGVTLALFLPVPVLAYYMFKTYRDKLVEQQRHYQEMADVNHSILEMLAMAIDAKDQTTHDHMHRVKFFATRMGRMLGLTDIEVEALKAGALLHDIGKIGVPAYILSKPGKLTEHEFEQMKMHTIIGADMLSNVDFRYPVVPIVRHHHERWDGKGYPDGLRGAAIPITARILTLVDNYDALRSDRPYHKAMTQKATLEYIKANAGTFFDPALVELFVSVIDELEEEASGEVRAAAEAAARGTAQATVNGRSAALNAARPATGLETAPGIDRAAAALLWVAETNHRVAALYEMSRTLAGSLSFEDTMAILANRLSKLIPFTTCAIALFDPNRSEFELVHAIGRDAKSFLRKRLPVAAGITGWVIQNQRPMFNTNPVLDLGFLKAGDAARYKAVMVFPLLKQDEALGAIALYSTDMDVYASEHIQLMESIVQPVSDS
ncbi:MAG TPA: HD domain-containing phosphohydrolase, partial [Blastocatellia bacterium]|nr:HD domain-containing phosphohydrolase [Blastocatellia bacterium]